MFYIDPEKLINAIKARPSLYNRSDKMYYANKNQSHIKEIMWLEVAEEVHGNDLLLKDRANVVSEVQKRWRSLRSCFARELAIQRREQMKRTNGSGYNKRRKRYEYFNSLLFLKGGADGSKIKNNNENESNEVLENCTNEQVNLYNDNSVDVMKVIKLEAADDYEVEETKRVIFDNTGNVAQKAPDTVPKIKIEEYDEDQQFALSIVPSLRKLDSQRKLEAKIEILKAIQAVTYRYE